MLGCRKEKCTLEAVGYLEVKNELTNRVTDNLTLAEKVTEILVA